MLVNYWKNRESVRLTTKLFGILLLLTFLAVTLACSSSNQPVAEDPSSEPVVVTPLPASTQSQVFPIATVAARSTDDAVTTIDPTPTSDPTANPVGPEAVDGYDALMAAALDSLPHFNRLGDDPGLSRFSRVPVNLDNVAGKMADTGDIAYAPILVDFLRVQLYYEGRTTLSSYLERLVGDETPDLVEREEWKQWSEWLGNHPEIEPLQGYAAWKGRFLSHIDPDMGAFFYDGVKSRIRLEEAVWGGVPKDGIPDLIHPPWVLPQEAEYLNPKDRVFGVSINGEHRAYPLRILNPHEMANDVLGGVPIALAY